MRRVNSGHQEPTSSTHFRSKTASCIESINADYLTPDNSGHLQSINCVNPSASTNLLNSTHCNIFNAFNKFNSFIKLKKKLKDKCMRKNLNSASKANEVNRSNMPNNLWRTDNAHRDIHNNEDYFIHSSCPKFVR